MMSSMKLKLSSVLIFILLSLITVNAHDTRILNPKYQIWTDTVNVSRSGNSFKLVSDGVNENQTTNLVDYQNYDFSKYPGMVIEISTDHAIKFNILFKSNNEYRYQEDDVLMLINDENKLISRINSSFGVYSIDEAFNGRIYLPLSKFSSELTNLEFWSMILVQDANNELNISINSIKLLNDKDNEWYKSQLESNIIKDREIQIPVQGESIMILPKIENTSYELYEPYEGVRLENNRLILTKDSKESTISLVYTDSLGYKMLYPINLTLSWIIDEKTDGVNIAFPDQTRNLKEMFDQWFDVKYTPIIQAIVGFLFVAFILFYRFKRNKRRVKKDVVQ